MLSSWELVAVYPVWLQVHDGVRGKVAVVELGAGGLVLAFGSTIFV